MCSGAQHFSSPSPNAYAGESMRSSLAPNGIFMASGTRPEFSSRKNSVYYATSPNAKAQESPLFNRNLEANFSA